MTGYSPKTFDWWRDKLAGKDVPMDTQPKQGFYAFSPSKKAAPLPVAIWYNADGAVRCKVGQDMRDNVHEYWISCMRNAITESVYKSVMSGDPWPSEIVIELSDGTKDSTLIGHNASSDEALLGNIHEWLSRCEKAKKAGAPKNQDDADKLADLATKLSDLCKEADDKRSELNRPHLEAQREINTTWNGKINPGRDMVRDLKALIGQYLTAENRRRADEAKKMQEQAAAGSEDPGVTVSVNTVTAGTRKTVATVKRSFVIFEDRIGLPKAMKYLAEMENVPPDVFEAVQTAVMRLLKAGVKVPGATMETKDVPR